MIIIGFLFAILTLALDQLSKFWAQEILLNPPQTMEIFDFLNLSPSWNKGVSFGLFNNDSPWTFYLLISLTIILILVLAFWIFQRKGYLFSIANGLILGGALGNLMDRFLHGGVFDFIDVHFKGYHFWTFNIADGAITIGAILFAADILKDFLASKKKGN